MRYIPLDSGIKTITVKCASGSIFDVVFRPVRSILDSNDNEVYIEGDIHITGYSNLAGRDINLYGLGAAPEAGGSIYIDSITELIVEAI